MLKYGRDILQKMFMVAKLIAHWCEIIFSAKIISRKHCYKYEQSLGNVYLH